MKSAFLFVCLTLSLFSFSQQNKRDTIKVLQEIVRHGNSISMPGLGYGSVPSRQWYSSAFLISLVTTDELVEMTRDANASLRLCAFIGLVYYNYSGLPTIRKSLSGDTTTIASYEGCIFGQTTVDYAVNHIEDWNSVKPMGQLLNKMNLDKVYRQELFDAIVHRKKIKRYY
jgi:hypothetical protein